LARIAARRAIPWQTPLHLHVVGLIPSRTYSDVSALHADSKERVIEGFAGWSETYGNRGGKRSSMGQVYVGCRGPKHTCTT
jgi:hypothetical protein